MENNLLGIGLWAMMATASAQVCLYDEHNRRLDKIPISEDEALLMRPTISLQIKDKTGKILLPLSANYGEEILYTTYYRHQDLACFSHRTWLRQKETGKTEAIDAKGNYLGYQAIVGTDTAFYDEPSEGMLAVKWSAPLSAQATVLEKYIMPIHFGIYGFADGKTGQLRIAPQFAAATDFQNGRAKVTYQAVLKSLSHTDFVPIYLSDKWFYIDQWGNRLPDEPKQDDLSPPNLAKYYDYKDNSSYRRHFVERWTSLWRKKFQAVWAIWEHH